MVNLDQTLHVLIVKSCEIPHEIIWTPHFAEINPTKTLEVRSTSGLCPTKGPRRAVLPAAESAVQSAGHAASRRGSACGRRNQGRRAWIANQWPGELDALEASMICNLPQWTVWPESKKWSTRMLPTAYIGQKNFIGWSHQEPGAFDMMATYLTYLHMLPIKTGASQLCSLGKLGRQPSIKGMHLKLFPVMHGPKQIPRQPATFLGFKLSQTAWRTLALWVSAPAWAAVWTAPNMSLRRVGLNPARRWSDAWHPATKVSTKGPHRSYTPETGQDGPHAGQFLDTLLHLRISESSGSPIKIAWHNFILLHCRDPRGILC